MFGLSFQAWMIIGVVAILLFGKNLPEMAKKFGDLFRR
jgi:Sec-independent protein translocase protein TatA